MAATYTCTQCNHVNEAERVYCHNCGVKLDRSLLPQDEKKEKEEAPEQMRKRVLKMTNPAKGIFTKATFSALVKTIGGAAIVAGLVQAVRPPDNIPTPLKDLIEVPRIGDRLDEEIAMPQSHQRPIPEDAANGYLQQRVKMKDANGNETTSFLKFERLFVHFEDGACEVNMKRSLMDFPIYIKSTYQIGIEENKLKATNLGGAFGRLPVHPLIMKYADFIFSDAWESLKRERKQLGDLKAIEVSKGVVVVTTYGAKPGAPAPAR